jgi:hypothetical protein
MSVVERLAFVRAEFKKFRIKVPHLEERQSVTSEDLSFAVRRWAMVFKLTDWDPWTQGPRDMKVVANAVKGEFPI